MALKIPGKPNEEGRSEAETFSSIRFFPKRGRCFSPLLLIELPTLQILLNLFEERHRALSHSHFFELWDECRNLSHIPTLAIVFLVESGCQAFERRQNQSAFRRKTAKEFARFPVDVPSLIPDKVPTALIG